MNREIKIFLASSSELKEDREAFNIFIANQNDKLHKKGMYLKLIRWENSFLDKMSVDGLQSEYNKAVASADIFIMLFHTKVGKYTAEEFETAWNQLKNEGKPILYTYFKDKLEARKISELPDYTSLNNFRNKLHELEHYVTPYESISDLKFHFQSQLPMLYEELGISLEQNPALETKNILINISEELKHFTGDKRNTLINVLAAILGIDKDSINILSVISGSVIVTVQIPKEKANVLLQYHLNGDSKLDMLNKEFKIKDISVFTPPEVVPETVPKLEPEPIPKNDWKKYLPFILIVGILMIALYFYFSPKSTESIGSVIETPVAKPNLHVEVQNCDLEKVRKLISNGVDITTLNDDNKYPIDLIPNDCSSKKVIQNLLLNNKMRIILYRRCQDNGGDVYIKNSCCEHLPPEVAKKLGVCQ